MNEYMVWDNFRKAHVIGLYFGVFRQPHVDGLHHRVTLNGLHFQDLSYLALYASPFSVFIILCPLLRGLWNAFAPLMLKPVH